MKEKLEIVNKNVCLICNQPITLMAFKGTGVCCENHRKESVGEKHG